MFKLKKYVLFILVVSTFSLTSENLLFAQSKGLEVEDFGGEISEEEMKNFETLTKQKIGELQNYITKIGDKKTSEDEAGHCIKSATALFHDNAGFEVSNKATKAIKTYRPVSKYFYSLRALKVAKVEITFYDVAYFSKFQKGTDGRYYGTAVIFQEFKSYNNDGQLVYSDRTSKQINITLEQKQSLFGNNMRWVVLLDDVKVQETK